MWACAFLINGTSYRPVYDLRTKEGGIAITQEERRSLQLSELEILKMFRKLCEKHKLQFYLTAGTLLGAVRHKGFIPWDDDIDVVMPREDYDRLRLLYQSELHEDYYWQDSFTEKNFPYFYAKIRKQGTEVEEPGMKNFHIRNGISIDIFPLDICPNQDRNARFFFRIITLLSYAYAMKVDRNFPLMSKKKYVQLVYRFLQLLPISLLRSIREKIVWLCRKWGSGKRLCTVGGVHGYPAETYEAAWFVGDVKLPFEGDLYPAPQGWDFLLKNMYGNYWNAPSGENRNGHFE